MSPKRPSSVSPCELTTCVHCNFFYATHALFHLLYRRHFHSLGGRATGCGGAAVAAAVTVTGGVAAAAACAGSVEIDPATNQRFQELALQHDVMFKSVAVGVGPRGRGLFATEGVAADGLLARVPLTHCVMHHRSESPEEDQDWPFWLASRLLKELAGTGVWAKYAKEGFLPSASEAAVDLPNARPTAWLERFSHWPLVNKLLQHREQTHWLYSTVTGRQTTPDSLLWAQALVLSRSFGLAENNDVIGLIPFLDMLNHAEQPNTKLHVDVRRKQIYAYALTPIEPGEELVIAYAEGGVPNAALLMKYGFVLADNTSSLFLLSDAEGLFLLDATRMMAYLDHAHVGWDTAEAVHLRTVLQGLPVLAEGGVSVDAERQSATELYNLLKDRLSRTEADVAESDLGPLALLIDEELELLRTAVTFLKGYTDSLA